jgi:hypothetical protein
VQQFGLEEAKTKTTPLSPAVKLSKNEGEALDKETYPYGTLGWEADVPRSGNPA